MVSAGFYDVRKKAAVHPAQTVLYGVRAAGVTYFSADRNAAAFSDVGILSALVTSSHPPIGPECIKLMFDGIRICDRPYRRGP